MLPYWLLIACATSQKTESVGGEDTSETVEASDTIDTMLNPVEQLVRVSMALRGIRPSGSDLDHIQTDPSALRAFAEDYVQTPEFGRTVRDMYAETLLTRRLGGALPAVGDLEGFTRLQREQGLSEEPLALIERVVMEDMPFTEIVTADWTVLDETAATIWADHTYDFDLGGEQEVEWLDQRPAAGVLTTNSMLIRWDSNQSNVNRGRANMVSDFFLCESFAGRDIPIDPTVDLSDPEIVADAIQDNPQCVACHQAMDPIGAHFWGHRPELTPFQITQAETAGDCDNLIKPCYPIKMYSASYEDYWDTLELRGPGYYGAESQDMETLGAHIASDPQFAQCQAKRFAGYLTQRDVDVIPFEEGVALQSLFEESDFDAKALAVAIVTSPAFLTRSAVDQERQDALPGIQVIRPEQLDRTIEALTDFQFIVSVEGSLFGDTPMLMNDTIGMRAMGGGVDGLRVTRPTHSPTPNRLMVLRTVAEEAAAQVVTKDLAVSSADRVLLTKWSGTDETAVRAQLVDLHLRILGESVTAESSQIDASYDLWLAALAASDDDQAAALTTVVTAFLQSPDVLYY